MPLKIPAVKWDFEIGQLVPAPPPIERNQYDFAPPFPAWTQPRSLTQTVKDALWEMSDDELTDLVKSLKGKRPMRVLNDQHLIDLLRTWSTPMNE